MTLTVAANTNTNTANGFTLAAQGDEFYVPFQTSVFATGATFSGVVSSGVGGIVEDHGAILGNQFGINIGVVTAGSEVIIGSDGAVSSFAQAAISITAGGNGSGFMLDNAGQVTSAGASGVTTNGLGQVNNTGTISGKTGISQTDTTAGHSYSLFNDGTIIGGYDGSTSTIAESISNRGSIRGNVTLGSGANDSMTNSGTGSITMGTLTFGNGSGDHLINYGGMGGLAMGNGNGDTVQNFGTMNNNVTLGSGTGDYVGNAGRINGTVTLGNGAGQIFDSTGGTVYGSLAAQGNGLITAGSGGDTIIGPQNGGVLVGGVGNDVLIANQTQSAIIFNNATTTLDGGGGINALYGGGAANTFIAGDTNGGYNQIWGGASQTGGGGSDSQYANNTLSFATAPAGVFVDLLNGHDAYVGSTVGGAWTGSGKYEDSIVNVPNVTGSAFGDVIQADDQAGDRITGGGAADQLYAGSGGSSQDTFVYTGYSDSNTVTGYDTIVGFKIGQDKIDLSALHTDGSHLAISTAGTSNTLYVEQTAGTFNAATDLAMIVNTTTAGGLHASDFVF